MSRARERREAARMKRQVPQDDDTDESEWDDVSGLGEDDEPEGEQE